MKLVHQNSPLQVHPLAELLPPMSDLEYQELRTSIRERGLRFPIIMLDNKVLDGIHRLKACLDEGIKPDFEHFSEAVHGPSPARFVMDLNLRRRHLSATQRATTAANFLPAFEEEAKARKAKAQFAAANEASKPAPAAPAEQATPANITAPATITDSHPSNVVSINAPAQPKAPATPPTTAEVKGKAVDLAAQVFGTSSTMIKLAKRIKKEDAALYDEVLTGKHTISSAIAILDAKKTNAADKAKKEKDRADRLAAIVVLEEKYGPTSQVVSATRKRSILKTIDELNTFTELPAEKGKLVLELLAKGWTTAKALKYLDGQLTSDSTIEELMSAAEAHEVATKAGKKVPFVRTFGEWTVTLTR